MAMTDEEIDVLLEQLLTEVGNGQHSEKRNTRPDCYRCLICGMSSEIKAEPSGDHRMDAYAHEPDCRSLKLFKALEEQRAARSGAAGDR